MKRDEDLLQWLPFKPLEMTYLVGKHGRIQFELVFDGPLAESVCDLQLMTIAFES